MIYRGLAGLGGVFLSIVANPLYLEGQTSGRGYIGLAAMIFGNWMPGGLAIGAGLFGYTDSLNLRGGSANVHALLLLGALLLLIGAIWLAVRKKYVHAVITLVIGALVFAWYALSTFVLPLPGFVTVFVFGLLVMLTLVPDSRAPTRGIAPTRRNLVLALLALAAFVPVALGMDLLLGAIPIEWGRQVGEADSGEAGEVHGQSFLKRRLVVGGAL